MSDASAVTTPSPGCFCGCSTHWLFTNALEPCGCGCACCTRHPATRDEHRAELLALNSAVRKRLQVLRTSPPAEVRLPRRRRRIDVLTRVGALWLTLALVATGLLYRLADAPRPGSLGAPAPVFSLPLIGAEGQYGTPELRGMPVVVNFWASWCGECRFESGRLDQVWRRHRARGLVVLGINVQDTGDDALGFLRTHGVGYPAVSDSGTVGAAFGVTAVPETYFLDGSWRFVAVHRGREVGADELRGWVLREAVPVDVLERGVERLVRP